jgi:hypothetical protein
MKINRYRISELAKTHVEAAQRLLQVLPRNAGGLEAELAEIWKDLDAYGRRSGQSARSYQERKRKSVLNAESVTLGG